ncbi:hypothetical protein D3C72_1358020 [compost metagenome]
MRQPARLIGTVAANLLQLLHQIADAGQQGAGDFITQDHQFGNGVPTELLLVDTVVGFACAHCPQQRVHAVIFAHRVAVAVHQRVLDP